MSNDYTVWLEDHYSEANWGRFWAVPLLTGLREELAVGYVSGQVGLLVFRPPMVAWDGQSQVWKWSGHAAYGVELGLDVTERYGLGARYVSAGRVGVNVETTPAGPGGSGSGEIPVSFLEAFLKVTL